MNVVLQICVMAGRGAGRHSGGGDCCGAVISLIKDLYLMDCCGYKAKQKVALGLTNNSSNSLKPCGCTLLRDG